MRTHEGEVGQSRDAPESPPLLTDATSPTRLFEWPSL